MLKSIDHERRLYVISEGTGVSCLGFEVCQRRTLDLLAWLRNVYPTAFSELTGFEISQDSAPGTERAHTLYEELLRLGKKASARSESRCLILLTEQLLNLEGARVEVVDQGGEKRRFWVGKSTGWLPVHLEISRRNSSGGPAVTGAPFKSIRVIRGGPRRQGGSKDVDPS